MEFVLIVLIVLGVVSPYLFYLIIKKQKLLKQLRIDEEKIKLEIENLKSELTSSHNKYIELEENTASLWKYTETYNAELLADKIISDANEEVKKLLHDAHNKSSKIINEANRRSEITIMNADNQAQMTLGNAREEAIAITREVRETRLKAKEKLDEAHTKAEEIIRNANDNAVSLMNNAEERAKEIAGSAYEAKEFAEKYESVANAMKNKIKGYGDEWIIPNRSILDELAEEYSFKDAGNELKKARELTRTLMRADKAASCQYVEPNRRNTAINFILDAFNGKVDTVMAKVRHNNYGKLSQEIRDAFSLVNFNGGAFRDAKITDTFLQARLNELRWAVAVNEILIEEKEEQRRIKEQLREEEKARKEYEKAIKDAEKEEKMIVQAIEKATKDLQVANDEQRAVLQQQLDELQKKYEEAEAKNQRAISMAQQTRAGHVYVISNIGSFGEDVFKIGMTRRLEPMDRVKELGDASVPFSFDVHAMIYSEDAPTLENALHRKFKQAQLNKINQRKEFFSVSLSDIKSLLDDMHIETHWTLKADAHEYRESLALARQAQLDANPEQELVVA
ncbi:DUF4041 domain-containing protein [Yersinia enterocolitica]|nr:DUF4041 domain-containing protein [Yersinia enterocolitica]EKN6369327.1 DUF4041 domain-containing protein [Yersinia enterocolitica]